MRTRAETLPSRCNCPPTSADADNSLESVEAAISIEPPEFKPNKNRYAYTALNSGFAGLDAHRLQSHSFRCRHPGDCS